MKSHSHIGFWVTVFLVCLFVSPAFVSAGYAYKRLQDEVSDVQITFGQRVGGFLVSTANMLHEAIAFTGADSAVRKIVHTEDEKRKQKRYFGPVGTALAEVSDRYFESLRIQLYGVGLRALLVMTWLLMLSPFIVAVAADGVLARQAKLSELGQLNPTAFALGSHVFIALLAFPVIYIAAPIQIPASTMWWWALASAVPASFALSHTQPIFTR